MLLVDSYGHVSFIYNIQSHDIPNRVWHIKTYAHMFYWFLLFQLEANGGRLSYFYTCVSLINQVSVIRSFTVLHRLAQLCFTRVSYVSPDKWRKSGIPIIVNH